MILFSAGQSCLFEASVYRIDDFVYPAKLEENEKQDDAYNCSNSECFCDRVHLLPPSLLECINRLTPPWRSSLEEIPANRIGIDIQLFAAFSDC